MRIKKVFLSGLSALVLLCLPLAGFCFGDVVADPTEWAKTMLVYKRLARELEVAQEQYSELQAQYQALKSLQEDAEGHYGYGGLLNDADDLSQREWSPGSWSDALQGLSGGNPARYRQLLQAYQAAHPTLSESEFQHGASKADAEDYRQQVHTNEAASVNASYAFNTLKSHLQTVYALSNKIEQAPNTKAATDLNSRLLAELAYINVQQVKQEALINEQMAQQSASRIQAENQEARFNAIPK